MSQNEAPSRRQSLTTAAAQLRPAVGFGLRVAVLAGTVIGAGIMAADFNSAIDSVNANEGTMCCIHPGDPSVLE